MAAVSAWSKPGAWALEAEEHEAMEQQKEKEKEKEKGYSSSDSHQSSDFPSLSAVALVKTTKKKKKQTFSLAEFASGAAEPKKFQPSSRSAAAVDEVIVLPTGPRERSAEELDRSRGFGFRGGFGRESRDEPRREREPRDMGPSRADEVDDWGATKRSVVPERRERGGGGGGGSFFDSQSRADESDNWISKKSAPLPPPMESRRGSSGGGRGYEMFNREGSNGVDSGSWGKKREEIGSGAAAGSGGRPRLLLQPRSVPLANESNGETPSSAAGAGGKSKGANPFGEARPREEVLKEKGKDWKEIEEKLDAVKSQEAPPVERKGFGIGSAGLREDRTERAWRKPDAAAANPPPERAEKVEQVPEN